MSRTIKDRDGKPYWKPPKVAKRIWNRMRRRKLQRDTYKASHSDDHVEDIAKQPHEDSWNWN